MRLTAASSCPAISSYVTKREVISAPANVICRVDCTDRGQPGPSGVDSFGHFFTDLLAHGLYRQIIGHQGGSARDGEFGFVGNHHRHIPHCRADPGFGAVVDIGVQR